MKCKDCRHRNNETKTICQNPKCDNYTDYVAADLECEDGEADEQKQGNSN